MGYTHFWYRPMGLEKKKFAAATADIKKLFDHWVGPGAPFQTFDLFKYSVHVEGGYETFRVAQEERDRHGRPGPVFNFCKTERLPYDIVVTSCLLVFHHHLAPQFKVSSNGVIKDWQPAIDLCRKVLDYKEEWSFKEVIKGDTTDSYLVAWEVPAAVHEPVPGMATATGGVSPEWIPIRRLKNEPV